MQYLKWYVFRISSYLYRIKCEPWYINQLYKDKAINEYRKCGNKEEAIKLCFQYNSKRRIKNGNKKI